MATLEERQQRHWEHVEWLRKLYEGMEEGHGKTRVKARWQETLADHRKWVGSNDLTNQPKSDTL